jgi:hypothetical protein
LAYLLHNISSQTENQLPFNKGIDMNKWFASVSLIAAFLAFSSFADLIDLGSNITASDKWSNGQEWHGGAEDQEVEPPDAHGQAWDLEGMFLDGSSLSMVGGYNFATGQSATFWNATTRRYETRTFTSGDIFIDINGDADYGINDLGQGSNYGYNTVSNSGGWDYAISLNFSTGMYDVYKIDQYDMVRTPYFGANRPSSPYEYVSGSTIQERKSFTYTTGLQNADVGFLGGLHNVVQGIDLSFLGNNASFTTHFTMGCGNDMIIGKGTVQVPEPGTLSLIGLGLLSLAGMLRFRRRK